MPNISIFTDPNLPANVTHRGVSALTKSVTSGLSMRRIQTNTNGTFRRLIGGEQVGKAIRGEFNAIIVALLPKVSRTFYEGTYDPSAKPTLPDCWSNDGVMPEDGVPNVQSSVCSSCPNNVAGSGENGKGRACRFVRRVALLLDGDPKGLTYQFNIPSKSLFGKGEGHTHPFESYVQYLIANDHALDYVVTKIAYDLEADTMQMNFTPVRPITDEEYDLVIAAQTDPETQRLIQLTVAEADGATAKPKADPTPAAKPKPAAQTVKEQLKAAALAAQDADDDEEDVEDTETATDVNEAVEDDDDEEVAPPPAPAAKTRAAPKPKIGAPKPKVAPEPAPAPAPKKGSAFDDDDDGEEAEEAPVAPVRRAGPKAKAPAPKLKSELADVISSWASSDDDED
jgi:hypothetical protein